MSAGGNTKNYEVNNEMFMSVAVDVTHDLHESDDKEATYKIDQKENDDGMNLITFTGANIKTAEGQEWFDGMTELVRSKARQQVFNTILESSKIENGLIKIEA